MEEIGPCSPIYDLIKKTGDREEAESMHSDLKNDLLAVMSSGRDWRKLRRDSGCHVSPKEMTKEDTSPTNNGPIKKTVRCNCIL